MSGHISRAQRALIIAATCALALLTVAIWPGHADARALARTPQITLDPNQGGPGTTITVQGKNFPTACLGSIIIDDNNTVGSYSCGASTSFQTQIIWPDGLDDGRYHVMARGVFGTSATTSFMQIALSPTPDVSATAAAGATATASAAQATATAQAQATSTAVAIKDSTSSNGNSPGSGISLTNAMLAVLGIIALLLVAAIVLIALALSHRPSRPQVASPYRRSTTGAPPPPPGVTTSPDDPWVWPTDPDQR